MVNDMSRATLNNWPIKIPFVHF